MYTPQVINQGTCIDNDYLFTAYDNLERLYNCAVTTATRFTCKEINDEKTGLIKRVVTELCFTIEDRDQSISPGASGNLVDKMLLLTFDTSTDLSGLSDSDNTDLITPQRSIRIVCDGVVVKALDQTETHALIITAFFTCSANAKIEVCFDSKLINVGGISFAQGNQTIRICGGIACVGKVQNNEPPDYFPLQKVDPDCCYGREAIHLLVQNASSLRNVFKEFGQVKTCVSHVFNDQDNHTLINTAPTVIDWIIVGTLEACSQNPSRLYAGEIIAEPTFRCGDTDISCLSRTQTIPQSTGNTISAECVQAPIVACGTCQIGDSLTSSVRSQFVCNEANSQVVNGADGGIFGVVQRYCLFAFERVSTDFGEEITGTIGKCLELEHLQNISRTMDIMADVCLEQQQIELVSESIKGIGDRNDCVTIQAAQPWPPLNDPGNTDPVPTVKLFVQGNIFVCVDNISGANAEDLRRVRATGQVSCGGTVIEERSLTWTLTSSGFVNYCGGYLRFGRCIECPIDQEITVCFTGFRAGGSGFIILPNVFNYTFTSFTF